MKSARGSVCAFWMTAGWLLAGVVPGVHAQETKSTATKPASSASSAAKPAPDAATPAAEDDARNDAKDDDAKDHDFLEFLGSVDSDATDDDWLDYLAQTDILKVAKTKKKAQAPADSHPASDKAGI